MFRPQEVLMERYQVLQMFAEGHFCEVYSAKDLHTNASVVVKKPKLQGKTDLRREYDLLRRLAPFSFSPTPLSYGSTANTEFYVMSHEGKSLGELVKNYTTGFNETTNTLILYHTLLAVQAIHEVGVSHCDITVMNVIVPISAQKGRLLLIDYGASGDITASSRRRDVLSVLTMIGWMDDHLFCDPDGNHNPEIEDLIKMIEDEPGFNPSESFQWEE